MKRCLITGATGFVGSAVTRKLAGEGVELGLFVRDQAKAESLFDFRYQAFVGDLHRQSDVDAAIRRFQPEAIVHLGWAGISGADRDDLVQMKNQRATIQLVESAISVGVRSFIGLGSQAEYGPKNGVIDEAESCEPVNLYGACKLASQCLANQLCRIADVRFAWLRLFSCYGPRDTSSFMIPTVIESLLNGQCPRLTPAEQRWDFLYVDDAADAVVSVMKHSEGQGVYNLGAGRARPLRKMVEELRDLIDKNLPLGFGDIPYGPNQIMHLEADTSRLTSIGWKPATSLNQGLATTIQWHRAKRES